MACLRCGKVERIPGQRWCRACLTVYARERRARMRQPPEPCGSLDARRDDAPAIAPTASVRQDGPSLEYLARIINGV